MATSPVPAEAEPRQATPPAPARPRRRRVSHTVTFSGYVDRWVTARMAEREQDRSGVVEDLALGEMDRGGRRLSATELNELAGHLNAIGMLLAPFRRTILNQDLRGTLAEVDGVLNLARRTLHGAAGVTA